VVIETDLFKERIQKD